MYTCKCDKCEKTVECEKGAGYLSKKLMPDHWKEIKYQVNNYNWVVYQICPECSKLLKITEQDTKKHLGDELLDIITEIAKSGRR
ncbi:MAG: hypothetical protein JXA96_17185 [Sedimentisphaerales bacterium]|nr:hypothetical protein [Sedimentisphaerales bacterium]